MREFFSSSSLNVEVHLEQGRRLNQFRTLAYYDPGRSGESRLVFGLYYDTLKKIGEGIIQGVPQHIAANVKATVYHELIHAADHKHLHEVRKARDNDLKGVGGNINAGFIDAMAPPDEVNVQWALLDFFSMFRAEGVAITGERLISHAYREATLNYSDALKKFNKILNEVLVLCQGLQFYHRFQSHAAHQELQRISLYAYEMSDVLLIKA